MVVAVPAESVTAVGTITALLSVVVRVTTTDTNGVVVPSGTVQLVSGQRAFTLTLKTAGLAYVITVNAVDPNWNTNTSNTNTVDVNDSEPVAASLVAGAKTFTVKFNTAEIGRASCRERV